jgi:hypothetical protein
MHRQALWELHAQTLPNRLRLRAAVGSGVVVGLASLPLVLPFLSFYHHMVNPRWIDFLAENERRILVQRQAAPAQVAERLRTWMRARRIGRSSPGALVGAVALSIVLAVVSYAIIHFIDSKQRRRVRTT